MKTEKKPKKLIDNEIDQLGIILKVMDKMTDDAQVRTFNFLKSKYRKNWPVDYN